MSLTKASFSLINGAPVNVLDYGANPTGTTDSKAAIQAAINTGKSIYIPSGIYLISAAITPSAYQTIYGDGPQQTYLKATTSGMNMIDYPSGEYSNIEITGLALDGNNLAYRGLSLIGTSQGSISSCYFSRISAYSCTEQNFYFKELTACSMNNLISVNGYGGIPTPHYAIFFEQCYNTYCSDSFFTSGNISTCGIHGGVQVVIQNTYMYNNGGGADSLMFIDGGFEHSIVDCTFEPQNASGTTKAVVELKVTDSTTPAFSMANVNFVRCYWAGLPGTAPYNVLIGAVGTCYKTKFNECVFAKQGVSTPSINLASQAYTSFENCFDIDGYYGLVYYPVSVVNTSGNLYFQENLPGNFATSILAPIAVIDNLNAKTVLQPYTDNAVSCGIAGARWSVVYAATGTINTSDERDKQDVKDLSTLEKEVAIAIKGLIKSFRFKDAVAKKGDKARIHFGVMAQQVAEAFKIVGLNPDDYALFCYDEWKSNEEKGIEAGNRYGIRYDELLAFVISAL